MMIQSKIFEDKNVYLFQDNRLEIGSSILKISHPSIIYPEGKIFLVRQSLPYFIGDAILLRSGTSCDILLVRTRSLLSQ